MPTPSYPILTLISCHIPFNISPQNMNIYDGGDGGGGSGGRGGGDVGDAGDEVVLAVVVTM